MDHQWTPRPKPDRVEWLERRIEFDDYAGNRAFSIGSMTFAKPKAAIPTSASGVHT